MLFPLWVTPHIMTKRFLIGSAGAEDRIAAATASATTLSWESDAEVIDHTSYYGGAGSSAASRQRSPSTHGKGNGDIPDRRSCTPAARPPARVHKHDSGAPNPAAPDNDRLISQSQGYEEAIAIRRIARVVVTAIKDKGRADEPQADQEIGRWSQRKSTYQRGMPTPADIIQWTRLEPMMAVAARKPTTTSSGSKRFIPAR